jgi:hypothetical protein
MRDLPSSLQAPASNDRSQQARTHIRNRLYGMKYVSDFSFDRSGGAPVEIMDSTNMETRPLRRR